MLILWNGVLLVTTAECTVNSDMDDELSHVKFEDLKLEDPDTPMQKTKEYCKSSCHANSLDQRSSTVLSQIDFNNTLSATVIFWSAPPVPIFPLVPGKSLCRSTSAKLELTQDIDLATVPSPSYLGMGHTYLFHFWELQIICQARDNLSCFILEIFKKINENTRQIIIVNKK